MAAVALSLWLAHPGAEMGFDDDFSYIWSARVLAQTGHVTYNGWAAMMLGWQLYLGALWIKVFGFSISHVHASMLVVALPTAALMQRTFRRMGLTEINATLATLSMALSPFFLPLAYSFMSDLPGLFGFVLCLYSCLRAMQARDERATILWLAFAVLSNDAVGTVRQIVWLGALLMVPSAAWAMRATRRVWSIVAALWAASAIFVLLCLHWYGHQQFAIIEPITGAVPHTAHGISEMLKGDVLGLLTVLLYAAPVLASFLVERKRANVSIGVGAVLAGILTRFRADWAAPFSRHWVTVHGLEWPSLIGEQPKVFSPYVQFLLTWLTFASAIALLLAVRDARRAGRAVSASAPLFSSPLVRLLAGYLLVSTLLGATRAMVFDRYFISLLFVLLAAAILFYQRHVSVKLPALCGVFVAVFSLFSIATLHDVWATDRARLVAIDQLQRAGLGRTQFYGGFEYDGWTQLEQRGYINSEKLKNPPNAFHFQGKLPGSDKCEPWFASNADAIHAQVELAWQPLPECPASTFAPVEYTTWLAPRQRKIYTVAMAK